MQSGDAKTEDVEKIREIRKEKDELEKMVKEMTKFLADYGLTWVGNNSEEQKNEGQFNF
jgi:hypothetical protein